jgi:hypothetical protein
LREWEILTLKFGAASSRTVRSNGTRGGERTQDHLCRKNSRQGMSGSKPVPEGSTRRLVAKRTELMKGRYCYLLVYLFASFAFDQLGSRRGDEIPFADLCHCRPRRNLTTRGGPLL